MPPSSVGWNTKCQWFASIDTQEFDIESGQALLREYFQKPFYLRGADYVMMFNSDKGEEDFEVQLHLIQPADVFVFWDDRFTPPNWLAGRLSATGDYIGMDECPLYADEQDSISNIGVGASESVEFKLSIRETRVMDISKPLTLGTIDQ